MSNELFTLEVKTAIRLARMKRLALWGMIIGTMLGFTAGYMIAWIVGAI